ncbi:hypothetical protein STENM223S_06795 [Streptomyces tendae]
MANHLVNWLSPLKERFTSVTGERGCFIADTLTADLTFHSNAAVATEGRRCAFRGVSEGEGGFPRNVRAPQGRVVANGHPG